MRVESGIKDKNEAESGISDKNEAESGISDKNEVVSDILHNKNEVESRIRMRVELSGIWFKNRWILASVLMFYGCTTPFPKCSLYVIHLGFPALMSASQAHCQLYFQEE